ncbi:MAG: CsbD family protein [Terriglobales bacterium]
MNKDTLKGKAKDAAGRVERQVGEWTDNPKLQGEGAGRQVEGKIQKGVGKVKDLGQQAENKLDEMRQRDKQRDEDIKQRNIQRDEIKDKNRKVA